MYDKKDLIFLALQLFLVASISFRAVARVLGLLGPYLGLKKTPCHQTIISWVNRLVIARTFEAKQVNPALDESMPSFWILDISIGLGQGKILAALSLRADHHLTHSAPTLQDMGCLGVKVAASFRGQDVADFLKKLISP